MTNAYAWGQSVAFGDQAADDVARRLRARGRVVVDITKMPDAQRRGVDYLIDGEHVDIKADRYQPVNVFLELDCNGEPGCFYKSRADAWLYYFPASRKLYRLNLPRLQHHIARHLGEGQYREVKTASRNGENVWTAAGVLVPIADLLAMTIAVDVSDWLYENRTPFDEEAAV